jgi:putative oxidoreductase
MRLGRLAVRLIVGALFVGHGTQKLFGWFGGHGLEGTAGFFESIGLRPGKRHATAAGVSEAAGGALVAAGLATPVAVASLSGVMITAIRKVHGDKGPWSTDGGYEYNLVLMAALFALADAGPGPWSLDHALGIEVSGPAVALGTLAAGAIGSTLALKSAEAAGEPEPARASEGQPDVTVASESAAVS